MSAEFARNRVIKMRNDYSRNDLSNKLGLVNSKENNMTDIYVSYAEIRQEEACYDNRNC